MKEYSWQKVLRLLQQAGPRGVHSWELYEGYTTRNASQRIGDLEKKGYRIRRVPERRNGKPGARYFLVGADVGGGDNAGKTPLAGVPQNPPAADLSAEETSEVWDWTRGVCRVYHVASSELGRPVAKQADLLEAA